MSREIAIMIDGGFLTKRLAKLVEEPDRLTPTAMCGIIRSVCRKHIQKLTNDESSHWHQHVYRIFYYDAPPFEGQAHHPLTGKQVNFKKSDQAKFQNELFAQLRKQRNMALRLGKLSNLGGWTVDHGKLAKLLRIKPTMDAIAALPKAEDGTITLTAEITAGLQAQADTWAQLEDWTVRLDLRQKGVDMRIGLDIASVALKRLASTIILIAGDADFVPAAKLARREGIQFILDPLWQKVSDDLFEHIDGLQTVLAKPGDVVKATKPNIAEAA